MAKPGHTAWHIRNGDKIVERLKHGLKESEKTMKGAKQYSFKLSNAQNAKMHSEHSSDQNLMSWVTSKMKCEDR